MSLLSNVQIPAGDGPHPTIIAIHGWGASAHDLFGLAPILHGGQALVLSPQGRIPVPIGPGQPNGWGWFPLSGGGPVDPTAVLAALDELRAFLDERLPAYGADPKRTVLLGFSQGGLMASLLALTQPDRFAGLAALSTWLPEEAVAALGNDPAQAKARKEALADFPLLVTHGSEDPMIGIERAYESRDRWLALGASPAFREYPMGHEIRPEALRDLVVWLEEKVLAPVALR